VATLDLHYMRCASCFMVVMVDCQNDLYCARKIPKCPLCPSGRLEDVGTAKLIVV